MCFIPLIFTRPFQSIHLSLGNIAHTFLYASLYPFLCVHYCQTQQSEKGAFFLSSARQSLTDESIVGILAFAREKDTCVHCHGHNRQLHLRLLPL